jgi:hypothetical protein
MMSVDSVIFVIITQPASNPPRVSRRRRSSEESTSTSTSTSTTSSSTSERYIGVLLRHKTNHRRTEDLRKPASEHLERTRTASRTTTSTFHRIPSRPADHDHDRPIHLATIQPLSPTDHRFTFHPSLCASLLAAEIWKADGTPVDPGGLVARRSLEHWEGLAGV